MDRPIRTYTRYRAVFLDGTVEVSIWTERPLTHCWRWSGQLGNKQFVGGSGFAGSEALALKQIKSGSSSLTKRPRRKKYDFQDNVDWQPGGILISEEIIPAVAFQVNVVDYEKKQA